MTGLHICGYFGRINSTLITNTVVPVYLAAILLDFSNILFFILASIDIIYILYFALLLSVKETFRSGSIWVLEVYSKSLLYLEFTSGLRSIMTFKQSSR